MKKTKVIRIFKFGMYLLKELCRTYKENPSLCNVKVEYRETLKYLN